MAYMHSFIKAVAAFLLFAPFISFAQQDTVVTADFDNLTTNRTGKKSVHVILLDTALDQVRAEGAYVDDKKNGSWLIYNKEARILRMETFKDGVLDGTRFARYENGEYERKERYKDGVLAEGHCYTEAGNEVPYFTEPYTYVERMPKAGYDVQKYLAKNIQYPENAKAKKLRGRVFIKFIVGVDGRIFNAKIAKGFDKECDEEALRVVAQMKPWKPGKQNGEEVNVFIVLPIVFQL